MRVEAAWYGRKIRKRLSRVSGLSLEEFDWEYRTTKRLDGIGRGFDPNGLPPTFTFIPHPDNFGKTVPRVDLNVSVDGSLTLEIIDDENTSTFFPNDRFTVRYDSSVSGVDFYQSYRYSDTNKTYGSGSKRPGKVVLQVHAYLFSLMMQTAVIRSRPHFQVLSLNGTHQHLLGKRSYTKGLLFSGPKFMRQIKVSTPQVDWKLSFDFNASEGNNTMLAQLVDGSNTPGHGELNASGNLVGLFLYSHLRKNKGIVKEFEIVDGGQNYQVGEAVTLEGEVTVLPVL